MFVHVRGRGALVAGAACAVAIGLAPTAIASAANAAATPPTVTVAMSKTAITFNGGSHILAGTSIFKIVASGGQHDLQLLQLHKGYSLQQAGQDINKAFAGNVPAVRRVDANITFLGGAGGSPGSPGSFVQTLAAGTYYAFDADATGNLVAKLTVSGPGNKIAVPHSSNITAFTYGFSQTPTVIPHAGWSFVHNQADQPHFLVLQQVKPSTTNADVEKFIKSGGNSNPSWGLKATASTGVLSPGVGMTWHYNLPAGKYLFACYWPDNQTGMPHFFMGMWELVQLH